MIKLYSSTQLTQQWANGPSGRSRSMKNKKPYRTATQQRRAKQLAKRSKCGAFHCAVPVTFHR